MLSQEITFHKLSHDNLDAVLEIERMSFTTPWSRYAFIREIQFEKSVFKVINVDGRVVGYGGFWRFPDEVHISNFAIHPDYRRRGLGRLFLTHLLEEAISMGATKATLEVRRSNIAARELYEDFGFRVVSVSKRYYFDENEDALIMENSDITRTLAAATDQKTQLDSQ